MAKNDGDILVWVEAAIKLMMLLDTILTRLDHEGRGAQTAQIRDNLRRLADMKPTPPPLNGDQQ